MLTLISKINDVNQSSIWYKSPQRLNFCLVALECSHSSWQIILLPSSALSRTKSTAPFTTRSVLVATAIAALANMWSPPIRRQSYYPIYIRTQRMIRRTGWMRASSSFILMRFTRISSARCSSTESWRSLWFAIIIMTVRCSSGLFQSFTFLTNSFCFDRSYRKRLCALQIWRLCPVRLRCP